MGLEKHVDRVIQDNQWELPFPCEYYWDNGLVVKEADEARAIMRLLDDSGQFGPTFYNNKTQRIIFAPYKDQDILKSFKDHVRKMDQKAQQDLLIALIHDVLEEGFFESDDARIESMKESIENITGVDFLESVY